jgi:hypothetical protein
LKPVFSQINDKVTADTPLTTDMQQNQSFKWSSGIDVQDDNEIQVKLRVLW